MRAATSGVILCLAYILGLLFTAFPPWGGYAVLALGIGAAALVPRLWRKGPKSWLWVAAGVVGLLASLYFQTKVPKPATNDISLQEKALEQVVTVRGKIEDMPRLTRSQRVQFWLNVTQLDEIVGSDRPVEVGKEVTGKLYVTVPLLQGTGLYPGETIAVTGILYKPESATNPGSFDFKAYLAQQGAFAGLKGRQVNLINEQASSQWGWWTIRQRIIRSQTHWLGIPEGPLVSAMVLGSQTVNLYLSPEIRDQFARVGLAHALAASGFQVSLILGIVLALTRRLPLRVQFVSGIASLLFFIGLAGVQAPVLRAVVMGVGALIALVMKRKIRQFSSFLIAATILLLFNPLWIWDLSFQLSFLATLGLLVTAPVIIQWLDWIPPLFASVISIPMAASLWTLPLQLYAFKVISPYSLPVNITTTILVTIISIGGFISAIAALIWPLAGSALAWTLYYPTHWLIALVEYFCQLPGNSVAVGAISILQLIALYGIICLVWLLRWWHRRWWLAAIVAIALVAIPIWQESTTLFQVTVLATGREPVMVIQDRGKVALINSGDSNAARFAVIPFLQQEGINKIDWAIATTTQQATSRGWSIIQERLPIANFYGNTSSKVDSSSQLSLNPVQFGQATYQPLTSDRTLQIGSTTIKLIDAEFPILQFQIKEQSWILLGDIQPDQQKLLAKKRELSKNLVLWWSGQRLTPELLKVLQPGVAIASSSAIDPETATYLQKAKTQVYNPSRSGAIQLTADGQFETTLELTEDRASLL
ncbi:ComEC/Rec2 family competence protein [Planktothrix sp. FACHB-1355]|uniref:ComEC/Rec2 family competence protein n=1 Tax=Aerosakkonema funiforme FACHB-1375 TaxID=2949571 RepID=A0A926ZK86_9CYAN|nr:MULTISPECIES: ComEC/Rec2 family competence protein [Oscillatoriales]MBD2185660.1 ComEC/Rec2 family competence protein [Aerosakkonema funiforme FACHB-1375]MBD3557705.1 ComEC/Rec2 family competence protein [Planktothrix sp. FACHB-1355]